MPTGDISIGPSPRRRRPERVALLVLLGLACLGCERTRIVDYEMTWSQSSDPAHIVFTFQEFPNHYVDITDEELRRYVEALPSDDISVQFALTTRLGCLERIRTTRIGDRDEWIREWGGSGWVGSEDPSPWKQFRCKIPWWRPGAGITIRF